MIDERIKNIRYDLGDAMGDYAPDYFRRRSSSANGWMIGAGGLLAAMGIGYLALRLADKRLQEVVDRLAPRMRMNSNGHASEPVKNDDRSRTPQGRSERPAEGRSSDGPEGEGPAMHNAESGDMPQARTS